MTHRLKTPSKGGGNEKRKYLREKAEIVGRYFCGNNLCIETIM